MEYIEEEPNFYLIQLKQKWTVVQFLLVGEESLYSKIWMKDAQTMIYQKQLIKHWTWPELFVLHKKTYTGYKLKPHL